MILVYIVSLAEEDSVRFMDAERRTLVKCKHLFPTKWGMGRVFASNRFWQGGGSCQVTEALDY